MFSKGRRRDATRLREKQHFSKRPEDLKNNIPIYRLCVCMEYMYVYVCVGAGEVEAGQQQERV